MPRVLEQPELKRLAAVAGLRLVAVDAHTSLEVQGPGLADSDQTAEQGQRRLAPRRAPPFDVILHKLHDNPAWEANLSDYLSRHPHVRVIDPPAAVHTTEDRAHMLAAIPPDGLHLHLPPPPPAPALRHPPAGPTAPAQSPPPAAAASRTTTAAAASVASAGSSPPDSARQGRHPAVPVAGSPVDPLSFWALLPAAVRTQGCGQCADGVALPPCGQPNGPDAAGPSRTLSPLPSSGSSLSPSAAAAPSAATEAVRVRAPPQLVLRSRDELREMAAAGGAEAANAGSTAPHARLRPPLLLKTQRADAAGGSGHGLAVATSWAELEAAGQALQGSAAGAHEAVAAVGRAAAAAAAAAADSNWVPLVVQQYVPHTDDLYKVYVLGRRVHMQRRPSLTLRQLWSMRRQAEDRAHGGPGSEADPAAQGARAADASALSSRVTAVGGNSATGGGCGGAVLLQHLSAAPQAPPDPSAAAAASASADGSGEAAAAVVEPPSLAPSSPPLDERALHVVAAELAARMQLSMFNFDVVVPYEERPAEQCAPVHPVRQVRELYVVDVNYFPGYDKLPGWEAALVEHLRAEADAAVATAARVPAGVTG